MARVTVYGAKMGRKTVSVRTGLAAFVMGRVEKTASSVMAREQMKMETDACSVTVQAGSIVLAVKEQVNALSVMGSAGRGPNEVSAFLDRTGEEMANRPDMKVWVLIGTITAFVLFWLRANISWWIFNPIVLGTSATGGFANWIAGGFIVLGLLKWVFLRLGARPYREIGVPAITGWIAGCAAGTCILICTAMWFL